MCFNRELRKSRAKAKNTCIHTYTHYGLLIYLIRNVFWTAHRRDGPTAFNHPERQKSDAISVLYTLRARGLGTPPPEVLQKTRSERTRTRGAFGIKRPKKVAFRIKSFPTCVYIYVYTVGVYRKVPVIYVSFPVVDPLHLPDPITPALCTTSAIVAARPRCTYRSSSSSSSRRHQQSSWVVVIPFTVTIARQTDGFLVIVTFLAPHSSYRSVVRNSESASYPLLLHGSLASEIIIINGNTRSARVDLL